MEQHLPGMFSTLGSVPAPHRERTCCWCLSCFLSIPRFLPLSWRESAGEEPAPHTWWTSADHCDSTASFSLSIWDRVLLSCPSSLKTLSHQADVSFHLGWNLWPLLDIWAANCPKELTVWIVLPPERYLIYFSVYFYTGQHIYIWVQRIFAANGYTPILILPKAQEGICRKSRHH